MLNSELRKTYEQNAEPQAKPTVLFPFYVAYQTDFGGPYCIGMEAKDKADSLKESLLLKGHQAEVTDQYPYELGLVTQKKIKKAK